jgi:hypothetical protein
MHILMEWDHNPINPTVGQEKETKGEVMNEVYCM